MSVRLISYEVSFWAGPADGERTTFSIVEGASFQALPSPVWRTNGVYVRDDVLNRYVFSHEVRPPTWNGEVD
mgnify:CR=1 FL=1